MSYGDAAPPGTGSGGAELDVTFDPRPGKPLGTYTASGAIVTGKGRLIGYSVRATTATTVVVQLYDGGGTNGQCVVDVDAAQGACTVAGPCDPGIRFKRGLYLNVAAGAPSVTVHVVLDA